MPHACPVGRRVPFLPGMTKGWVKTCRPEAALFAPIAGGHFDRAVIYSAAETVGVFVRSSGAESRALVLPLWAMAENDDLALIRAYLDGDAAAFDKLFGRYNQRIRSVCTRYVGDGPVADDLVQDTFYNVLRTLDRIDSGFNFSAWIHRIAVNLCHDELRRRTRTQQHVAAGGDEVEEAVLRLVDRDRQGHPEAALEIAHLRQLVWDVAKRLPERQRMVLTLRELQGLSYASIARVMGISESAVETLLHRARKRFKEVFLRMDDSATRVIDCAAVGVLVEADKRRPLRRDQRAMLIGHVEKCDACRERFCATQALRA
jgi:RNA polymerase sigma-70 factor, ECF subfamily